MKTDCFQPSLYFTLVGVQHLTHLPVYKSVLIRSIRIIRSLMVSYQATPPARLFTIPGVITRKHQCTETKHDKDIKNIHKRRIIAFQPTVFLKQTQRNGHLTNFLVSLKSAMVNQVSERCLCQQTQEPPPSNRVYDVLYSSALNRR